MLHLLGLKKIISLNDDEGVSKDVDPIPVFDWSTVTARRYKVYKTVVLNFDPYFLQYPSAIPGDALDSIVRSNAQDITRPLRSMPDMETKVVPCLTDKFSVGRLDEESGSCLFVSVMIYVTYLIVLGVTLVRFFLALIFDWFIANSLSRDPLPENLLEDPYAKMKVGKGALRESLLTEGKPLLDGEESIFGTLTDVEEDVRAESDSDLYTVLLVTCYSEGQSSIQTTLESLAGTEYNDRKKLLFVVADGIITGKGNPKSTPDLIIDMLHIDPNFGSTPSPFSYKAVASGKKQHNMAKVYCGHFAHKGHSIPTVVVVKCGNLEESSGPKPGNRGKRDSQMVLINFFNRVILNEKMTPLDFDLFRKIHHISGVTPDFFEIVLMVDADTRVASDSMRYMINCMYNDPLIMGLCGETLISNKRQSWVTRIQVFEYYISHHLGKAFESVWGGVTCLPGCFCCYRLKARKTMEDGSQDWIPMLVTPEIVKNYSTNRTETLHEKNLLLLGEDRFLSTLMLRQFPRRKMVFVPKAQCFTVVPDDFKTLLSQRRRWINSTVHNLMELVFVQNLCGTFCFSMQFVVLLDVIGTAVLPISLILLFVLLVQTIYKIIVRYAVHHATSVDVFQLIPLFLLIAVLFLPAALVALTSRHILSNLKWMLIYMLALPIWQLVLPLYAFWHFDDFSWGETRKVVGTDTGHGDDDSEKFDPSSVPMKKWEDYERSWRRNILKNIESLKQAQQIKQRESSSSFSSQYTTYNEQYSDPRPGHVNFASHPYIASNQNVQLPQSRPSQETYVPSTFLPRRQTRSHYVETLHRMPQLPANMPSSAYNADFYSEAGSEAGSSVEISRVIHKIFFDPTISMGSNLGLSDDQNLDEYTLERELFTAINNGDRESVKNIFSKEASETSILQLLLTTSYPNEDKLYFHDPEVLAEAYELLGESVTNLNAMHITCMLGDEDMALEILEFVFRITDEIDARKVLYEFLGRVWGFGNTVLHLAAFHGMSGLVEKLLQHGANPNKKNDRGYRPVDCTEDNETRLVFNVAREISSPAKQKIESDSPVESTEIPKLAGTETSFASRTLNFFGLNNNKTADENTSKPNVSIADLPRSSALSGLTPASDSTRLNFNEKSKLTSKSMSSLLFPTKEETQYQKNIGILVRERSSKPPRKVTFDSDIMVLQISQFGDPIDTVAFTALRRCLGLPVQDEKIVDELAIIAQIRIPTIPLDINSIMSPGQRLTPLHLACTHGHTDMVHLLLRELPVQVNVRDKEGWTPLHCAAAEGHIHILKLLISCQGWRNNDVKTDPIESGKEKPPAGEWFYPIDGPINLDPETHDEEKVEDVALEEKSKEIKKLLIGNLFFCFKK
ncbi:hypothetical protein HK096_008407 [Nowakowskiella sp. JEL0078]|nr:hypothetical protein HK096_008407 [Nowakowskiella sp. JEL0078]